MWDIFLRCDALTKPKALFSGRSSWGVAEVSRADLTGDERVAFGRWSGT